MPNPDSRDAGKAGGGSNENNTITLNAEPPSTEHRAPRNSFLLDEYTVGNKINFTRHHILPDLPGCFATGYYSMAGRV